MVADSVEFLRGQGREVLFDAEHFFDGYKRNAEFGLRVLEGAVEKGASTLVLCDTNGGSLPHEVERIVADVVRYFGSDVRIGVHTHDDTGCGVAELAGKSTLQLKAKELGLAIDGPSLSEVVDELKRLEHEGYHFEAADGSLELLLRRATGWEQDFFRLESFRVITDEIGDRAFTTEATVKVHVGGERKVATAEGNGPVNALDRALRLAVVPRYPILERVHLTDYKVRVLDTAKGTGAITRVLIDTTDGERSWSTIGVSDNIIEASWQALSDSIVFGLLHNEGNAAH